MDIIVHDNFNDLEEIWSLTESISLDKNLFTSYDWAKNYWEECKKTGDPLHNSKLLIYVAQEKEKPILIMIEINFMMFHVEC